MLTEHQIDILAFTRYFSKNRRVAPTIRCMTRFILNLSENSLRHNTKVLLKRGYLTKTQTMPRKLELTLKALALLQEKDREHVA